MSLVQMITQPSLKMHTYSFALEILETREKAALV